MDAAEKAALMTLQNDLFNARADFAHERECVVSALRILHGARDVAARPRPDDQRVMDLCRIIDDASEELNRTRKK